MGLDRNRWNLKTEKFVSFFHIYFVKKSNLFKNNRPNIRKGLTDRTRLIADNGTERFAQRRQMQLYKININNIELRKFILLHFN